MEYTRGQSRSALPTLLAVGPFPPPFDGQASATQYLRNLLVALSVDVTAVPLPASLAGKVARHLTLLVPRGHTSLYLSAMSNSGFVLTAIVGTLASYFYRDVFIHYHSYRRFRKRSLLLAALVKLSRKSLHHIVLGDSMATAFRTLYGDVPGLLTMSNAGLMPTAALEPSRQRVAGEPIVVGHMSNLTAAKGSVEVIDLFFEQRRQGRPVRMRLAGPVGDRETQHRIDTALAEAPEDFIHLGPVYGEDKEAYLASIDLFVFPSRYPNEAEPIVILECLQRGIPCLAYDIGCLRDQISDAGAVTIDRDELSRALTSYVLNPQTEITANRTRATEQFGRLKSKTEAAIDVMVQILAR